MLVVENRNASACLAKGRDDLLHHFVAWVENLLLVIPGIVPMFGDEQDPLNSQLTTIIGQSLGNRSSDANVELSADRLRQVIVGYLIHVHGRNGMLWHMEFAALGVAENKPPGDVIRVR